MYNYSSQSSHNFNIFLFTVENRKKTIHYFSSSFYKYIYIVLA